MPYVPPKPRSAKAVEPEPELETKVSSITPAFTSSSFQSPSKSDTYSPLKEAERSSATVIDPADHSTPPDITDIVSSPDLSSQPRPNSVFELGKVIGSGPSPTLPDTTDIFSPQGLSRASTTSVTPSVVSKRSSWTHRKPVPSVIALPTNSLPSSHPFARGNSATRSKGDIGSPPVSPRLAGPVPPRRAGAHNRSISNLATPVSPTGSDFSHDSGMLWTPPVPEASQGNDDVIEELRSDVTGTPEHTAFAVVQKRSGQPQSIPSRQSSRQSTPTPSRAPELGAPVSVGHHTASSITSHESEQRTPPASSAHHPLRLRVDKSLPALPLNADGESIAPGRPSRHNVRASTSSGPSTHIVTPRSVSQAFVPQQERAGDQEKRKVRWPKSLIDLSRGKKDKSPGSSEVEKAGNSAQVELEEDESFSVDRIPSKRRLFEAGTLFLRDENGDLVCFGDLFPKTPTSTEADQPIPPMPRTVIFFIRHFWCGQCQDFMFASLSQLDPVAVEKAGIKVVVISNGSWKILKSYKKLFNCPFPIYVDGPRKLYSLLGMTKMTNDFGPSKGRAAYNQHSAAKQLFKGGKNAITKLPLAYPGKLTQLGGEFILSPGYNCDFAHRMTNTSNHMEAPDVLREAGCEHPTKTEFQEITIADEQRVEFERLEKEMQEWRNQRATELDRIRRRKAERRGEEFTAMSNGSMMALGLRDEDGLSSRRPSHQSPEAQAAVPLPVDESATVAVVPAGNEDGPVCLPVGSAGDVLTWEDDEEDEATLKPELNALFEKAVRLGEIEPSHTSTPTEGVQDGLKLGDIKGEFPDATFGRNGNVGSGLEVKIAH